MERGIPARGADQQLKRPGLQWMQGQSQWKGPRQRQTAGKLRKLAGPRRRLAKMQGLVVGHRRPGPDRVASSAPEAGPSRVAYA